MGALSWWHWLIVVVVLVILFGSKKLPEAARGLGQSMRIFKSEVKEMQNDGTSQSSTATPAPQQISAAGDAETAVTNSVNDQNRNRESA